jgi:hypothetical protein
MSQLDMGQYLFLSISLKRNKGKFSKSIGISLVKKTVASNQTPP